MQINFQVDLFSKGEAGEIIGNAYSSGTTSLIYKVGFSITRLVPVQSIYTGIDSMYSGLSSSEEIKITNGSSFTVEYQTRYIPIAFPKGSNDMVWKISSKGYTYHIS